MGKSSHCVPSNTQKPMREHPPGSRRQHQNGSDHRCGSWISTSPTHPTSPQRSHAETAPRVKEWDGRILLVLGLVIRASAIESLEFIYAHFLPTSCRYSPSPSTTAQPPSCSRTGVSTYSQAWPTWVPCYSVGPPSWNPLRDNTIADALVQVSTPVSWARYWP